jgi:hypothetical protein
VEAAAAEQAQAAADFDAAVGAQETSKAALDVAEESAATAAADEHAMIEAASNRETVTSEMVEAVRDLLGI